VSCVDDLESMHVTFLKKVKWIMITIAHKSMLNVER